MKVLIVLLLLTVRLGSALKCYECNKASVVAYIKRPSGASIISILIFQGLGSDCEEGSRGTGSLRDSKKTCGDGKRFCIIKDVDFKTIERGCSDLKEFPEGYEAVDGDTTKKCKSNATLVKTGDTPGGAELYTLKRKKDCLCSTDLCNENMKATPTSTASTGNLSTIASLTLLTSLLLAMTIVM